MSEETTTPPATGDQAQQQIQLTVDERELRMTFANSYRFSTTTDEVIMDVCFNMPNPSPNPQGGQHQLLLKVSDRIVMTYPTAKRLAGSLTQLVKRYEQQFGEIAVQNQPRR